MILANSPDETTVSEDAILELTEECNSKNKPSLCQGLTAIKFLQIRLIFWPYFLIHLVL